MHKNKAVSACRTGKTYILAGGLFGLIQIFGPAAQAGDGAPHSWDPEMAQTNVSLSQMDFSTDEGLVRALGELEAAALEVCTRLKPNVSYAREFMSDCQRRTVRQAVSEIDDERLTNHYEAETTLKVVDRTKNFFQRFRR